LHKSKNTYSQLKESMRLPFHFRLNLSSRN
jgi:hypothetical protein